MRSNQAITLADALHWGQKILAHAAIDSPLIDAELLLTKALFHPAKPSFKKFLDYNRTIDRARLYMLSKNQEIKKTTRKTFEILIAARAKRIPLAYLLNIKNFFRLPFFVDECVLIPRPQTETLVEHILASIETTKKQDNKLTILDIGTGSGCIIVSIAAAISQARIHAACIATDSDPRALAVARNNAKLHNVRTDISFFKTPTLPPLPPTDELIIAANLPYLDTARARQFIRHTPELAYEPTRALFTGEKGLHEYRILFQSLLPIIPRIHAVHLFLEIDPTQKKEYLTLAHTYFSPFPQVVYEFL